MAGKNEQKAGFTSCLCLFFISIFLCASMEFHYIFPPPTPLLQHPLPLLCQCSCLTTPRISSPKMFSNMPSLSNNQKIFFVVLRRAKELVFHITQPEKLPRWNGRPGSTNSFFLPLTHTDVVDI